jgi:hypothetical protein
MSLIPATIPSLRHYLTNNQSQLVYKQKSVTLNTHTSLRDYTTKMNAQR